MILNGLIFFSVRYSSAKFVIAHVFLLYCHIPVCGTSGFVNHPMSWLLVCGSGYFWRGYRPALWILRRIASSLNALSAPALRAHTRTDNVVLQVVHLDELVGV